ncbi:GPI transamidase-like protein component Gpi16 [Microthyrium microscopicum]|uniref:GPI transamidase-like protein component Gpi16 n=1 Tax=Microthyrium microscopicum TaxID=703497 RepID=A0A6A6UGL6_9PEZI|nr:GPI transamidase-like protein component Gpi16 [Microthyrium microscopicum]
MIFRIFLSLLLLLPLACCSDYHEKLLLRPLPGNALLASFNFRSNATANSFDEQNFRYFPRSFGQILQHAHTKELHLRFSVGRWDAETWGARPWNGAREGGTGVELWAWVEAKSDEEANSRWLTLTNALSGLFCASLNFIDSTRTIRPMKTFEPEGLHPKSMLPNLQLLHGVLPHEVVCTENLTPFVKLLPCKGKAGISSLLDGHKLFDASWQVMSIDVRPICHGDDESNCILEIEQTVDMVLDRERSKRPRDNPIPRPLPMDQIECDVSKPYHAEDSCYPLEKSSEPAWDLAEIFGRHIKGDCPITGDDSMTVCVNTQPERIINVFTNPEDQDFGMKKIPEENLTCFEPPSNGTDFSLSFPEQNMTTPLPLASPRIHAFRSITGYGQERGGIQAIIQNPSSTEPLDVIYLESLPWYMKPYLHTLRSQLSPPSTIQPIKETYYRPALDRRRGTHLELKLHIPPGSSLTLTYDIEKAILRYTEYPPDANRGFDVAPAAIRVLPGPNDAVDEDTRRRGIYVRTTSLLLPLPTPDFSMPYNVIILTSTVMALGFGGIFNILVRRFVAADEVPENKLPLALTALVARFRGRIRQVITKAMGNREKTE